MNLIDSHCHIHFSEYGYEDIELELDEARAAGVCGLLAVSCDLKTSKESVTFAKKYTNIWPVVGVHPHESRQALEQNHFEQIEMLLLQNNTEIVGIGECGLDYFYEHSPREQQIQALEMQLDLAIKYNKPVSFHVRDAFEDFWPVLANFPKIEGVLHSFTDTPLSLQKALRAGLYIGINGIITFSKDEVWAEAIRQMPIEKILLETDAPYLTPKPYRGKINKLAYVRLVADHLATLKGLEAQKVASITSSNTQELFRVKINDSTIFSNTRDQ